MSNPGSKGSAIAAFFASMSITGNPTVDTAIRYCLFGASATITGAILGWLNARGFSSPDLYAYVPMGVLAVLFGLATMIWGVIKTSKNELLIQLREAIAVKAGIAAAENDEPTPEVNTVSDAKKVIATHAPAVPPEVK